MLQLWSKKLSALAEAAWIPPRLTLVYTLSFTMSLWEPSSAMVSEVHQMSTMASHAQAEKGLPRCGLVLLSPWLS